MYQKYSQSGVHATHSVYLHSACTPALLEYGTCTREKTAVIIQQRPHLAQCHVAHLQRLEQVSLRRSYCRCSSAIWCCRKQNDVHPTHSLTYPRPQSPPPPPPPPTHTHTTLLTWSLCPCPLLKNPLANLCSCRNPATTHVP